MNRSPERDRRPLLLAGFLLLWVVAFGIKAIGMVHPVAQPIGVVADPGGGHPVVREFLRPAPHRPSQLQVGDRVLLIGDTDLRGGGQVAVLLAFSRAGWQARREVPVLLERAGSRLLVQEPMPLSPGSRDFADLLISVVVALTAVLILLRATPSEASRTMFLAQAIDALLYLAQISSGPTLQAISLVVGGVLVTLTIPSLLRAGLAFPEEAQGSTSRWRWLPWLTLPIGVAVFAAYYGFPISASRGTALSGLGTTSFAVLFLAVLTRNYRRSGPVGQRQVKWLMYACYLGFVIFLPVVAFTNIADPDPPLWSTALFVIVKCTLPVSVLIASLRYDLLDINRLFGATVLYNVLVALGLTAGLVVVPRAADALTAGLEIGRGVAQTGLTVALGIGLLIAGRRLLPTLERRLFRERFNLEVALRELPEQFAGVREPGALWELTGQALTRILRPASCVIFTRADDAFVPVFASAGANPPLIPADAPILTWLDARRSARRITRADRQSLGALGTALLDELEGQVVVPIHRRDTLEAVLVLGEKQSGDIYTSTDEAMLAVLGKSLSTHILRFDEAELLARAQAIQARMQRYVPGALADVIAEGAELETGEREVSVLFVDIRGYTAYADGRDVGTVFTTVNRYTEAVSSIVRAGGGVVVEFNGDGMMAVFGAPRPLPDKEAAAVRTAVRLATEVPRLAAPDAPLHVGVGVATGPAFVGNIEAVDRMIWSAIGSTTNLAARLQSHTREVGAAVLIDALTWSRAGAAGQGFQQLDEVRLRGRRAPETVHALIFPDRAPPPMTPLPESRVMDPVSGEASR